MTKKVKINIDGTDYLAPEGSNLLHAARSLGVNIPGLCFHPRITPTGACRLCVVKVKGMAGTPASCALTVRGGMEIITFDDEIDGYRRQILRMLMKEHRDEADPSVVDEFRDLIKTMFPAEELSQGMGTLVGETECHTDFSSPVLEYDSTRCIRCFRCIKACGEIQGKWVLSMAGRGLESWIAAGQNHWAQSECDGCGECVQLCPTAALAEKPYRKSIRLASVEKTRTTCPYCGVGCQMDLWVQEGKIVRVTGTEGVWPNQGRLCVKGRFGYDFVGDMGRLTKPLIRKNGELEPVSWSEALQKVASEFSNLISKHGSDSLAGYSSAKCTNEDNYIFQKFIRTVFGNNNVDYCTRLCHASTVTAMLRSIGDGAGSNSISDFAEAECVFVLGNNMTETHPVTATWLRQGKARGHRIIVADPKWTPLVKYADIWLQPRLGTDVALLNAMIHVVIRDELYDKEFINSRIEGGMDSFANLRELSMRYSPQYAAEICGVEADKIEKAAKMYAGASTSLIATGMGLSQQVTGTANVFSLLNLCLICGQIGKEHAGINPPRGQNNVQGATDVGASPLAYPGYIPVTNDENRRKVAKIWNVPYEALSPVPGLTTVEIMQAAYRGGIRGMYIMGENPVVTDPNRNHTLEALKKLDFLVVQDIFLTDTAALADVVLPAASFAEKEGTFVNSDRRVLRVRRALQPPGEAMDDWRIIAAIAGMMGKPMPEYTSEAEIFDEIASITPMISGVSYSRLKSEELQWPCPSPDHNGTPTLFLQKFNTPTGLARLHPVDYVPQNEQISEEYPFLLNTGRILYQYHSSTMSARNDTLNRFSSASYVLMHPDDALRLRMTDDDDVMLISARGSVHTNLRISDQVLRGELFMPFHDPDAPVNNLTRDELDPLSRIAPFKLSACRVEKCR